VRGHEFESCRPRSREFCAKNAVTCDFDGDGRTLASGPLPRLKIFFPGFFRIFLFLFLPRALCRELRSAKALPRALEALPRAWGPRQSSRLR
jgi:hypothetical protein